MNKEDLEKIILNALQKCEGLNEQGCAEVIAKHVEDYLEKRKSESNLP